MDPNLLTYWNEEINQVNYRPLHITWWKKSLKIPKG